jgi:hypothetical protein
MNLNAPIRFRAENFTELVDRQKNVKITSANGEWIENHGKEKYAERFNRGEYIPSVSDMQIYGRKEQVSKFEAEGLWKPKFG